MEENKLLTLKNLIVYDDRIDDFDFTFLIENFCGRVIRFNEMNIESNIIIYMTGNIQNIYHSIKDKCTESDCRFYAIEPFSYNFSNESHVNKINYGFVPINVHNLGIYFRNLFDNYYDNICDEHSFSELTESNKPNNAFRKGVYLSNVKKIDDAYEFNLLRCSTNFHFPTENFRSTEHKIINVLNDICSYYFEKPFDLNHVLAQIYENKMVDNREKKARISSHSDKTKDMSRNALMAFCTFYKDLDKKHVKKCGFDHSYKNTSVLTKLVFRKKKSVENSIENSIENVDLTLYPSSAFVMPLSTNRLYTHEISPSNLDIGFIPTRMGYVVRCSKTVCVHKDGKNYILDENKNLVEMIDMKQEDFVKLKKLYFEENTSNDFITYPFFNSSMNNGDYMLPIL